MNIVERYLNILVNFEGLPKASQMYNAHLYAIQIRAILDDVSDEYYFVMKNKKGFVRAATYSNYIVSKKIMRDMIHQTESGKALIVDGDDMRIKNHTSYILLKSKILEAITKNLIYR
jgi:hypothetical protein